MKVTNILFWVDDLAASREFYQRLGMMLKMDKPDCVELALGEFIISLVPSAKAGQEFASDAHAAVKGKGMYLYIQVDDVDVTHAELKTKGIVPATEPRDWPWGEREFIVKDPDGYKLCFWQELKPGENGEAK